MLPTTLDLYPYSRSLQTVFVSAVQCWFSGWELTTCLVKNNISLPLGLRLSHCGLTAKKQASAPSQMLVIEYGITLLF